jgi:hypothetical protein
LILSISIYTYLTIKKTALSQPPPTNFPKTNLLQ